MYYFLIPHFFCNSCRSVVSDVFPWCYQVKQCMNIIKISPLPPRKLIFFVPFSILASLNSLHDLSLCILFMTCLKGRKEISPKFCGPVQCTVGMVHYFCSINFHCCWSSFMFIATSFASDSSHRDVSF